MKISLLFLCVCVFFIYFIKRFLFVIYHLFFSSSSLFSLLFFAPVAFCLIRGSLVRLEKSCSSFFFNSILYIYIYFCFIFHFWSTSRNQRIIIFLSFFFPSYSFFFSLFSIFFSLFLSFFSLFYFYFLSFSFFFLLVHSLFPFYFLSFFPSYSLLFLLFLSISIFFLSILFLFSFFFLLFPSFFS